jgi:hypothetical protein
MNSDNKFGTSCNCPAIMNYSRDLTNWSSSRTYNINLMKKLKINNFSDYREVLQNNTNILIKNTRDDFDKNYKCANNNNQLFYLDSTNYNNSFDKINNI